MVRARDGIFIWKISIYPKKKVYETQESGKINWLYTTYVLDAHIFFFMYFVYRKHAFSTTGQQLYYYQRQFFIYFFLFRTIKREHRVLENTI